MLPIVFNQLFGPGVPTMIANWSVPARHHTSGALGVLLRGLFGHTNIVYERVGSPLETNYRWTLEIIVALVAWTE